jgi:transcriptional regulator of acetoin/glycerol metabolism
VDAAGYAHERDGEMPEPIALVAAGEPEATLRAEVLSALQVRRPELRPMARWMAVHDALLLTLVASEGDVEGLLVLPRMARDEPVTLEELRALKRVADHLAAACRARQRETRMLARAHEAALRAEASEERVERLRHERQLDIGRDALAAIRLARPATVGIYSAASRMALEALERRTLAGAPIAVVAPSGVDPVPYLARAHLAGARRDGPLVLVDATSAREHDHARWTEASASPLALAHRGMLVLLDGAALPADVQQLVARSLAERRAPWERPDSLDVQLALTGVAPPDELVARARLDPALALRLADARETAVALPRLRDRPEDLRAIVTDRLAREGLRVLGRPVGIEHAAFARVVDYPFPGEEAELAAAVQQLVAGCACGDRDVVRVADVDALELGRLRAAHAPHKDPLSA